LKVLSIDQKFEGNINSDTLIINESGVVDGDIVADTVVCKGRVNGNITASQKVEMHPKSLVVGDIQSPALQIEEGAVLDGRCDVSRTSSKITSLK